MRYQDDLCIQFTDKDRPTCAAERERWKAGVSFPHPFLLANENRAVSIRANTNKENIPSSSDSSSDSVREDTGCIVDAQGGQSALSEQTPKPRKTKHSPTLVQFTGNQDAHTVSHSAFSPHFSLSLYFVIYHLLSSCIVVFLLLDSSFVVFLSHCHRSVLGVDSLNKAGFSQLFIATYRLLQIVVNSEIAAVFTYLKIFIAVSRVVTGNGMKTFTDVFKCTCDTDELLMHSGQPCVSLTHCK